MTRRTGTRVRPEREGRRRRGVAGAFAVLGIAVLAAVGATPDLQPLTRIDIVTLNRLAIARTNGAYVLRVQATFRNRHPRDLRLRDGRFTSAWPAAGLRERVRWRWGTGR